MEHVICLSVAQVNLKQRENNTRTGLSSLQQLLNNETKGKLSERQLTTGAMALRGSLLSQSMSLADTVAGTSFSRSSATYPRRHKGREALVAL